ncbi:MAG: hypothetical protein Alis3KO_36030 [Aliiglaciecola sp.]
MHKVLITILFVSGIVLAEPYPESYDAVDLKYQLVGINGLSEKEKAIFTIWWLEAEVNNGGFNQYFWNSAGDNAGLALESLNKIGASKTAELLKEAIEVAFSGSLPLVRADRQKELEIEKEYKMEALGKLDSSFYEYQEDFYKMLNNFGEK